MYHVCVYMCSRGQVVRRGGGPGYVDSRQSASGYWIHIGMRLSSSGYVSDYVINLRSGVLSDPTNEPNISTCRYNPSSTRQHWE